MGFHSDSDTHRHAYVPEQLHVHTHDILTDKPRVLC